MQKKIEAYLKRFWETLPADSPLQGQAIEAYHFCADQSSADRCAELVLMGEKRATASLLWSYQAEEEQIPEVGQISVITNWAGEPQCVIEVTAVSVLPFGEVPAEFAREEGEGDKTLDFWRKVHWEAFSRECGEIGCEPLPEMPVVLERFKVLYR